MDLEKQTPSKQSRLVTSAIFVPASFPHVGAPVAQPVALHGSLIFSLPFGVRLPSRARIAMLSLL
jgi:hypothetical protein